MTKKHKQQPKSAKRNNEKVVPNPNPADMQPMYIARRKRVDKMTTFEDKPLPWKYSIK